MPIKTLTRQHDDATGNDGPDSLPLDGVDARICQDPDCGTHLSRYNDLEFCSLHAPMIVPRMRGKVLDD